ncbi:hypothetical protein AVEN_29436-1 [Araneus ventricosus]|uniref:Uncharacterized protein n=1 Tax=Araneus ventricosus TaxID=182803 RepID=A0A4Y2D207_ARAVE|nr:hypothetical protein AVEN_29436-1 [Araneus ventricosus]
MSKTLFHCTFSKRENLDRVPQLRSLYRFRQFLFRLKAYDALEMINDDPTYVINGRLPLTTLRFREKSQKHYYTLQFSVGETGRRWPSGKVSTSGPEGRRFETRFH